MGRLRGLFFKGGRMSRKVAMALGIALFIAWTILYVVVQYFATIKPNSWWSLVPYLAITTVLAASLILMIEGFHKRP